ncbi:hypothetical protein BT96DRAFT_1010314 [Gymnopus androsaceus JB14]|uniref:Uncharacterized protein n=1 Tax=Gymnopus androsaceus JB14 TaxID=1447944 RepID=A0A6A4GB47_9AGAR|nr:hypothetical protein BT96DRAFT_1010314 [Gymnopus androsaceus JB14]
MDQLSSVVVNDRGRSLPPPASHVNSGSNTPSNPAANSSQRKFVPAMTLCPPINLVDTANLTQVDNICSKVTGYSPTFLQGYLNGKLIIDLHNQNSAILITVSKDANTICNPLTNKLKHTFIVVERGPVTGQTTRQLHVLGEYAYRGSSPSQLTLSDYELLPEASKDFIVETAKGTLDHKEIKTKQQLVASLCEARRNSCSCDCAGDCKIWEGSGTASSGGSS